METVDGMVVISKREYDELLNDSRFLQCLESSGVDNWQWYDEAVKEYNQGEAE